MADDKMRIVYRVVDGVYRPIREPRPEQRPRNCGASDQDCDCLGCGIKLGRVKNDHCYAVEGEKALLGK